MNKILRTIYFAIIICSVLMGCASGYRQIQPSPLTYQDTTESNNVQIAYQTNVLNGKYALNETKTGVTLLAVKITNNT